MQSDGRKIRDILLVRGNKLVQAIEQGILQSIALSSGEDASKHGLPVVEIAMGSSELPVEDYFARLGLSEIPREFVRQEFESRYAREISATLGLPIGQFWHDPRGTNRSLEQVTQERSTLKGPSYFIRSLERVINGSTTMGKSSATRSIIQFQEETDNASMKNNAEALKAYTEAIKNLNEVILANPDDKDRWNGFFERTGLIPPNTTLPDIVTLEEDTLQRTSEEVLEKGMIRLDSNGLVIERRADAQVSVSKKDGKK